jgi:hypothetical protein
MPTGDQVRSLIEGGWTYSRAAELLGISPGLAYLIATGIPADGSDTVTDDQLDPPHTFPGTTQHLANPQPAANPTRNEQVTAWMRQRASSDRQMQQAAAAQKASGK